MNPRAVSETRVVLARMIQQEDANPVGNAHGGSIMKFIDDAAAVVATRHARRTVVTAAVERLEFHAPVFIGNLLSLKASMNRVGRTSMEVGVRVEAENLRTGEVRHTSSAYLTFVALDEDKKPTPVPPLLLETDEDRRRCREAELRQEKRGGIKGKSA